MILAWLRNIWRLPADSAPPRRTVWDWLFVAFGVVLTVIDFVRAPIDDAATPVLLVSALIAITIAVLVRRTNRVLAIGLVVVELLMDVALLPATGFPASVGALTLVVVYAVVRWGSGREFSLLIATVTPAMVVSALGDPEVSWVGTVITELVVIGAGLVMRQYARLTEQELRQARLAERQRIARELHDSVAHHVSAIAIQARAAEAVVASDPSSAAAAMRLVAGSASEALAEMRQMVKALRDDDAPSLRAPVGLEEIEALARRHQESPRVEVRLSGGLDHLEPAIKSGLFRIAQESVTNASRHARHARRVTVDLIGRNDEIELVVVDDGELAALPTAGSGGFGLIGMRERVSLLGGTFTAGPLRDGGWRVAAVIPRPLPVRAEVPT